MHTHTEIPINPVGKINETFKKSLFNFRAIKLINLNIMCQYKKITGVRAESAAIPA